MPALDDLVRKRGFNDHGGTRGGKAKRQQFESDEKPLSCTATGARHISECADLSALCRSHRQILQFTSTADRAWALRVMSSISWSRRPACPASARLSRPNMMPSVGYWRPVLADIVSGLSLEWKYHMDAVLHEDGHELAAIAIRVHADDTTPYALAKATIRAVARHHGFLDHGR